MWTKLYWYSKNSLDSEQNLLNNKYFDNVNQVMFTFEKIGSLSKKIYGTINILIMWTKLYSDSKNLFKFGTIFTE